MKYAIRVVTAVVVLSLIPATVLFAAGAAEETDEQFDLRLATVVSPPHPWIDMAEFFAEEVRQRTDGNVNVRIQHSGALGDDEATIDEMRIGTIDFVIGGVSNAVAFVPEYQITGFPYLYEDLDHFRRVIDPDAEFFQALADAHEERGLGLRLLALAGGGTRVTSSNLGPLTHPDDFDGVRMRLPGNPLENQVWEAIGAVPTSLPWGEIYTAVQSDVVSTFESTVSGFYGSRLYEVAPHQTQTKHQIMISHFTMSEQTFEQLPAEYRDIILEVAREAGELGTDMGAQYDEELVDEMVEEYGLNVYEADIDAFVEAVAPLHDELAEQAGIEHLLEYVRAAQ